MSTVSSHDIRNIHKEDCIQREFPLHELGLSQRPLGFQIVVRRSTLNVIKTHGQTSLHAEVGGMLVGSLLWDNQPFLFVEASIAGKHTDEQVASVTFTAKTWEHVWSIQERDYPNKKIVGWYHTHPGFGVFLSPMDMFICEYTFNAPYHVAYVYDPQSDDDGWFVWKNSTLIKLTPLIIEDEPQLQPVQNTSNLKNFVMQAAADKIVISSEDTQDKWTVILVIISTILLFACTGGIGYLVWENIKVKNENSQLESEIETLKKNEQKFSESIRMLHDWAYENSAIQHRRLEDLRRHQDMICQNMSFQSPISPIEPLQPPKPLSLILDLPSNSSEMSRSKQTKVNPKD
ncbi:MAG: Mov34/MPN/PAD-1 family protein [Planctomycetaceae bacterium]|jgi:proteasome lid subunit RPN8/RPN11/cell division protein FtsB|nr:Mov34/MPN/PAD-1 family protein [Planctomycetaceae bacterium]